MAGGESVIGIDLGTTYSCVGVWHNEKVEIIANNQGNRITPSWVSFSDSERLLGESAKNGAPFNLTNSIYDAKRLIGRRFSDETVQSDMKKWPFQVVKGPNDEAMIAVKEAGLNKEFSPEEISSMVLKEMKKVAEVYLGHKVSGAVVTVPAYFNETQRRATLEAGDKAGLKVLKIMDEPTAGAVAYGFKEQQEERLKNIFVFDLGGGTCDVSWLTVTGRSYVVRATAGNTHLGGEDFDNRMVDHFVDEFRRKHGKNIASDARAIEKLKKACEIAKRRLASDTVAKVQVECLYQGIDFSSEIKRARFDDLNKDYFLKCMDLVDQCVKRAEIGKQSIDKVVLVGGSTRILKIQEMLKDYFVGKQLYRDINPDEAVAFGATVQAAILSRCGAKSWEIVDRTPLSLGIDSVGDRMSIVIPRDTPIPFSKKKDFTTAHDNQKVVEFPVYQGESAKASDNHFLGKFELTDIRPAPKGEATIDVWFDMDANGILNVSATNCSSGRKNNITITRGQLGD